MDTEVGIEFWHEPALGGPDFALWSVNDYVFDRHIHDELVIAVTEKGYASCCAKGVSDLSRPGTIWVSGAGDYHAGRTRGGTWQYRAIYLDEAAFNALKKVFNSVIPSISIPPDIYYDPQLAASLINMHKKMEENAPLLERETLWLSTMGLLFERYGRPKMVSGYSNSPTSCVELVRDYLHDNFHSDISLRDLTEVAGLSKHYLIRAFKNEYGLPPHAYVNQIRLNHARRLLSKGETPALVATTVGFYDQSHLNRLFKKTYSMTPGQYATALRSAGNPPVSNRP